MEEGAADPASKAVQEMKASIDAAYDLWNTAPRPVDTRVDNEGFETSANLTALAGHALGVLYESAKKTPGGSSCEYLDEFNLMLAWLTEVSAAARRPAAATLLR